MGIYYRCWFPPSGTETFWNDFGKQIYTDLWPSVSGQGIEDKVQHQKEAAFAPAFCDVHAVVWPRPSQ
jgi:hypothetical protein